MRPHLRERGTLVRLGSCLAVGLAATTPTQAHAAATLVINVVITLNTMASGATVISGVTTAPATTAGNTSAGAPSSTSSNITSASSTSSATTTSGSGISSSVSTSISSSPTSTPGCTSSYPQALATLNTFAQALLQVESIYSADHAAGVISDSAYKLGWSSLLGIGLDAGAAHDMIRIGGDATDITAQIATLQSELATVTNADLVSLVGQMQSSLASASAGIAASASCAVSVSQ